MKIYLFSNGKICPTQQACVIAESVDEALEIIKTQTLFDEGWQYEDSYAYKKGLLFWGDVD